MSREVEFMLSNDNDIMAVRSGSVSFIGDSRSWWETIWDNRERFSGTAHSHPSGFAGPSGEDISTYKAYATALGPGHSYYVVTDKAVVGVEAERGKIKIESVVDEPWWTGLLRSLSNYSKENGND